MQTRIVSVPVNGFKVCVDEVLPEITGNCIFPVRREAVSFSSFTDLLVKADGIFDETGYPGAFQVARSFAKIRKRDTSFSGKPEAVLAREVIDESRGKIASLVVVVESRRNSSWQGAVYDSELALINKFASEMELSQIVDNVLGR